MSYSESEAVAKDFQEALEDIQSNARYEIQNLTLIARENTEHALAISGALTDHVKRAAPHKKLPSLYVLDSIVKNVGTPYTLFFGRKLYQTFMDAYASVDMTTRRKMDEMLKTWKEPVPGSIDTRPVFPPDVVRPIENALLKARSNALQAQQGMGQPHMMARGRPMPPQGMPYRESATPPGARPYYDQQGQHPGHNGPGYGHPAQPSSGPFYPPHQQQYSQPPARSTPQPSAHTPAFQPPPHLGVGYPPAQNGISIDSLNDDIQRLIGAFRAQIAQNPHDASIQTRLKALMDLQTILQLQNLPQEQLVLVKNQITELAVTIRAPSSQAPTPVPPPVAVAPPPAPAATSKVSLDSLLGSGALAALMARNSVTPQPPTPQPPPAAAALRSPPPRPVETQKPPAAGPVAGSSSGNPLDLLNALRAAGIIGGSVPPPSNNATPVPGMSAMPRPPPPPPPGLPTLPIPLPGQLPTQPPSLEFITGDISLKASSLKQYRPHLLPLLFEAKGPQCTQCGRRFPATDEGRRRKTAHMDWHFRVNRRITEYEKKGQHRSWLVDKMDWINTRETIDQDHGADASGRPYDPDADGGGGINKPSSLAGGAAQGRRKDWIPVPDDPVLANSVCPICQEKFEMRWLDDAQEFVWPDATHVGDRIYHASCHREATKDDVAMLPIHAGARGTPEPVLGKRKAESELTSLRGKMKMEAT